MRVFEDCYSRNAKYIYCISTLSSGASSDFDSATKIAKMMVTRFGMCEKVCLTHYGPDDGWLRSRLFRTLVKTHL